EWNRVERRDLSLARRIQDLDERGEVALGRRTRLPGQAERDVAARVEIGRDTVDRDQVHAIRETHHWRADQVIRRGRQTRWNLRRGNRWQKRDRGREIQREERDEVRNGGNSPSLTER